MECAMKKERFEILLKKIDFYTEFLVAAIEGINRRLDRAEIERARLLEGSETTLRILKRLEEGQARMLGEHLDGHD